MPAAAPARNGGPLVIIGAALKRAEAHIARAENEGENVAIFKKQLAAVKAKLAKGGLTPPELEDLQIAASRLEQDTSDL